MMGHQSFRNPLERFQRRDFSWSRVVSRKKNGGRKRREISTTRDDTIGWPSRGLSETIRMRFEFWMRGSAYVNMKPSRYDRVVVQRQLCRRSHPAKGTADRFRDLWSIDLHGFSNTTKFMRFANIYIYASSVYVLPFMTRHFSPTSPRVRW